MCKLIILNRNKISDFHFWGRKWNVIYFSLRNEYKYLIKDHIMEYYSAIKRNTFESAHLMRLLPSSQPLSTMWTTPGGLTPSSAMLQFLKELLFSASWPFSTTTWLCWSTTTRPWPSSWPPAMTNATSLKTWSGKNSELESMFTFAL